MVDYMSKAFISVNDLVKTYYSKAEELAVLRGTSFEIHRGELVCLLGTSGSGKTTTLNILAGIDKPTSGEICYGGQDISSWPIDTLYDYRLNEIGFIFQEFYLLEHLTALENVMVPMLLTGTDEEIAKNIALKLLSQVGLGGKTMNHPEELSSGEKQRVCVSRAIANSPSILIADEPTGTLDSKTGDGIMQLLLEIARTEKMTMIYTTHDPYLTSLASRVFVIQKGIVAEAEISNVDDVDFNNIVFELKGGKEQK
jgi:putative ABC transport system ATP-binding protein